MKSVASFARRTRYNRRAKWSCTRSESTQPLSLAPADSPPSPQGGDDRGFEPDKQDDSIPYEKLSLPDRFNIDCDR